MSDAGNSDSRLEKVEQALRTLRKRVDEQWLERQDAEVRYRHGLLTCSLAGAMVALTATTWRVADQADFDVDDVQTLWGMMSHGWPPVAALVLVLALGIGTFTTALGDHGRVAHLVLVGLALLTAAGVLFAGNLEPSFGLDASDYSSGPGRWLTLLCALGLAGLFGARASDLS